MVTQILAASQFRIKSYFSSDSECKTPKRYDSMPSIWFTFISRLFSVVWGLADIYLWKGIWDGVDCFLCSECGENHKDWVVAISTFSIGTIILILAGIKYIGFYRWLSDKFKCRQLMDNNTMVKSCLLI